MTHARAPTLVLLLLLGSVFAAAPAAAQDSSYSCEATGASPTCTFACPEGAHVRLYSDARGANTYVSAKASCGGASVSCAGYTACDTLSPDSTAPSMTGSCTGGHGSRFVYCEALSPESEGASCGAESPHYWVCGFTCTAGDRLHVDAITTGPNPSSEWPRLHAACGGVDIVCQANGACRASSDVVLYDDNGVCRAETVYVDGLCSSGAQAQPRRKIGATVPAVGIAAMGPFNVTTPRVGQVCAPAGIVCAGPFERQEVASVPATPAAGFAGARVSVEYTDTQVPGVATTTIDPIHAPKPVPLTICAFGCTVPSGTTGSLVVELEVRVSSGDHVVEQRVASPEA